MAVDPAFEPGQIVTAVQACLEGWLNGRGALTANGRVDMVARIVLGIAS